MLRPLIVSIPLSLACALAAPAEITTPGAAQVVVPHGTSVAVPQAALIATIRLHDLIAIMHDEGIDYGKQLEDQLFPGEGGARWQARVEAIYDPTRMQARFEAGFAGRLDPAQTGSVLAFLGSPLGQRIVGLEIAARRALLDPDVEDAAKERLAKMAEHHDTRLAAIRRFAAANDLVEANVVGAMNANVAFYTGLAAGHAPGFDIGESEVLSDVAGQEDDIRKETEDWLFPFLVMAYQPLSDHEMARYTAFAKSPAGRALNRALFASFDAMFEGISHRLGLAAAEVLSGQTL